MVMDEFQKAFQELKRRQSTKMIKLEDMEEADTEVLDRQLFDEEGNLRKSIILKLR